MHAESSVRIFTVTGGAQRKSDMKAQKEIQEKERKSKESGVCELMREKDLRKVNTESIVITRFSLTKGERKKRQRGRQSGRQRQKRKNLCEVLIVVSD